MMKLAVVGKPEVAPEPDLPSYRLGGRANVSNNSNDVGATARTVLQ